MAMTAEDLVRGPVAETAPDVISEGTIDEDETSPEETLEDAPEDAESDEYEVEEDDDRPEKPDDEEAMAVVDSVPTVQNPPKRGWGHPTDEGFVQIIEAIKILAEEVGLEKDFEDAFPLLYKE